MRALRWAAVLAAAALVLPAAAAGEGDGKAGDGKAGDGAGAPAPAKPKDTRPVSGDDAAMAAIERFERDFKATDQGKKMNAMHSLAATKNDLVAKKLGTLLLHPDPEIRAGAAMCLDGQYQNVELCGEILRKAIASKKEDVAEVLMTICLSLGRIDYRPAIPDMGELALKNGDVFVKIEVMKSFRKMKDKAALLPILDLWLVNPQGYSWEGGEVKVDTGAPGDTDQKAAEAEYKKKYGHQGRKGAPPTMLKTYLQAIVEAVAAITGEKLSTPTELMRWMVAHEKELPFPLPAKVKTTLQEFEDRAARRAKQREKEK
ncbi:MAG: hypothetical protein L6R43_12395 [Planctomycetes bacterium]|nr:hypothetical protein [Planctomycetota bacterium]